MNFQWSWYHWVTLQIKWSFINLDFITILWHAQYNHIGEKPTVHIALPASVRQVTGRLQSITALHLPTLYVFCGKVPDKKVEGEKLGGKTYKSHKNSSATRSWRRVTNQSLYSSLGYMTCQSLDSLGLSLALSPPCHYLLKQVHSTLGLTIIIIIIMEDPLQWLRRVDE